MNPRIRSRMPASIGSNQASPANKDAACAACTVVLSSPMARSPPARQRRSWLVEETRDYATLHFHHRRDGTQRCDGSQYHVARDWDSIFAGMDRTSGNRMWERVRV